MGKRNPLICVDPVLQRYTAAKQGAPELQDPLYSGTCIESLLPLLQQEVLAHGKTEIIVQGTPTVSQRQALAFFEEWGCSIRTGAPCENTAFVFVCAANPLTGAMHYQLDALAETIVVYLDFTHCYGWVPLPKRKNTITALEIPDVPYRYLVSSTYAPYALASYIPPLDALQRLYQQREQHLYTLANATESLAQSLEELGLKGVTSALPHHLLMTHPQHCGELFSYFLYKEGIETMLGGGEYPLLAQALIDEGTEPSIAHRAIALSLPPTPLDTTEVHMRIAQVLRITP